MFAASGQSNVFHLTQARTTVCGLRVSPAVREKRFGSRLHLLFSKPSDGRLCKSCLRISNGELARARGDGANLSRTP
jgi:hypothetical protein